MNKNKNSKTKDKLIITWLTVMIILGLLGATSCKSPEKFKFDKPKFNISKIISRCK